MPHSELTITADHAMLVNGAMREAGTLVDGTAVTLVPLSEFREGCAVHQVETEIRAITLANGAPSETFVDNVLCRALDGFAELETPRCGAPVTDERSCPRASAAGRPESRINIRLGLGSVEETVTRNPPVEGEGACIVAERAT